MKAPRIRFSPSTYARIMRRQGFRCACGCKEGFDGFQDIRWDHILPLHLGGKDEPENLQALKRGHHAKKTHREASARAKTVRIQKQDGLRRKKVSERDKVMAKVLER